MTCQSMRIMDAESIMLVSLCGELCGQCQLSVYDLSVYVNNGFRQYNGQSCGVCHVISHVALLRARFPSGA